MSSSVAGARPPSRRAWWLLVIPVGFNLWVLRNEARTVENLNDGSLHAAMIRTAARAFRGGHIPLDAWFPQLSTGTPNFHEYQSLPHIITGLFATVVGGNRAYSWSVYLLLALWPIAVYAGARLLEWDTSAALGSAFFASLVASRPGYGYEWISYTFGGLGVWTQLWGMWLLPISLGLTWQAVEHRKRIVPAAIVLAVLIVSHVITGYFAALALVVWVAAGLGAKSRIARVLRGAGIGAAAAAASAWLMIPVYADQRWHVGGTFTQGFWRNSFGARKVIGWLVTGNLFDRGFMPARTRFPVITILVFLGVLRCVLRFRVDVRARALLGLFALSLVLFAGRPTFGFVINLLPGSRQLLLHRYILAVHIAGIILAGVGAGWVLSALRALLERMKRPAVAYAIIVVVAAAAVAPGWSERAHMAAWSGHLVRGQVAAEAADHGNRAALIDRAKRLDDGRIYAGLHNNWGATYKVGFVPGVSSLLNDDADGIGFTFRVASMFLDAEAYLNDATASQLNAYGIRYVLTPRSRQPSVPAQLISARGNHALWEIPSTGYVALVDTVEPISIRTQLHGADVQRRFLNSAELAKGLYPTVKYLGRPAAKPTASAASPPAGSPGTVTPLRYAPFAAVFRARVDAGRAAAVMLKSSYTSRWRVRVDGRDATTYMVAPGFPAVTVTPGLHDVEFRYRPVGSYPFLFGFGVLALAALYVLLDPNGRRRFARLLRRQDVGVRSSPLR